MSVMHFTCGPSHPNTVANYNFHVGATRDCCQLSCYCNYFVVDGSSLSVQHEQATLGIPKPKLGAQDLRTQ
ncbi:hypothetical protein HPP92_028585, partial [Vanilla planifolia]